MLENLITNTATVVAIALAAILAGEASSRAAQMCGADGLGRTATIAYVGGTVVTATLLLAAASLRFMTGLTG